MSKFFKKYFSVVPVKCGIFLLVIIGGIHSAWAASELPLPRFVSLKSSEANVRTGPGLRYQIKWVLVRPGMPLEVTAEFEQWRRIRDIQGAEGWVHRAMISGKRAGITMKDNVLLLRDDDADAFPIARIEQGVYLELLECDEMLCEVAVDGYQGWMPRDAIWGIYSNEKI